MRQPAVEQAPASTKPASVEHPASSDVARRTRLDERIGEALNQPVDITIEPQSLRKALDFIAARYQIPILIDQKGLDDANVDTTQEVSLSAPGISVRDTLQLLLDQMSAPLGFDIWYGVLMITTAERMNAHCETIVYDCRDLIKLPALVGTTPADHSQSEVGTQASPPSSPVRGRQAHAGGKKPDDAAAAKLPFTQTMISATGTDCWVEGTSISELGGLLIVRQNLRVRERIKSLLASIRLMRKDGAFAGIDGQVLQPKP